MAGTWGIDLAVQNDTLSSILTQKMGEMMEEAAANAGCESEVSGGKTEATIGKVIKGVLVITKIEGEEGKYEAIISVENEATGETTEPAEMEVSLYGNNVTISGDVEFLRIELKGSIEGSNNMYGTFTVKLLDEYASLLEISPNAEMNGSLTASRLEE